MKIIKVAKELKISLRTIIKVLHELNIACDYKPTAQIDEGSFNKVKSFLIANPGIANDAQTNPEKSNHKKELSINHSSITKIDKISIKKNIQKQPEKEADSWTQRKILECSICKSKIQSGKYKYHLFEKHFSSIKSNWDKFPLRNDYFLPLEIEFVKSVLIGRSINELTVLFEIPSDFLMDYLRKNSKACNTVEYILSKKDFEGSIDLFMTLKYLSKQDFESQLANEKSPNGKSPDPMDQRKKVKKSKRSKSKAKKWPHSQALDSNYKTNIKIISVNNLDPKILEKMERAKIKNPVEMPKGRDRKIPSGAHLNKYGDGFWIVRKR